MRKRHIAVVYNAYVEEAPDLPEDRGSTSDLRLQVRNIARHLRHLGHTVTIAPLADDLFAFQHRLRRISPDVVFNLYDDVVHGALYDMRLAALVRMMGYPMTGCSALALGLTRYKFMAAGVLAGAGVPIPPNTAILETVGAVDHHKWDFPIIVQPAQEHGGIGLDRASVVSSKKALRDRVRLILQNYRQPASDRARHEDDAAQADYRARRREPGIGRLQDKQIQLWSITGMNSRPAPRQIRVSFLLGRLRFQHVGNCWRPRSRRLTMLVYLLQCVPSRQDHMRPGTRFPAV
jgi:hypothetical protein